MCLANGAGVITTASNPTLANLPWNGNSLVETSVPDSVFEECLEKTVTGKQVSGGNVYFSNSQGNIPALYPHFIWNDDRSCCSGAFAELDNPYDMGYIIIRK